MITTIAAQSRPRDHLHCAQVGASDARPASQSRCPASRALCREEFPTAIGAAMKTGSCEVSRFWLWSKVHITVWEIRKSAPAVWTTSPRAERKVRLLAQVRDVAIQSSR